MIKNRKEDLPIVILKENVLFPNVTLWVTFDNEYVINSIAQSMLEERLILFAYPNESNYDESGKEGVKNLCSVGTYSKLIQVIKVSKDVVKVLVECQSRVLIGSVSKKNDYLRAKVTFVSDAEGLNRELFTYAKFLKETYEVYRNSLSLKSYDSDNEPINYFENPSKLVDIIASNSNLENSVKLDLLQELNVKTRIEKLIVNLNIEIDLLDLKKDINSKVRAKLDKGQRDYFLSEQVKEIQKRLGKDENEYIDRLNSKDIPEDVKSKVEKEISRLSKMQMNSPDANIIRSYIELILDLPWNENTVMKNHLSEIEFILRNSHYGMDEAKEKIINFLAVYQINSKVKAPILCLVGPPGIGKTSLVESIARSLSREFVKISLGGLRDEAEIRGHRRTYVGSLPGVFISAMKRSGKSNPVILLDEIDKINNSYKGNPESAF
ncbi:ATP-dependent protease LA [Borreliella afzelii HLJ01]|nr:ATP-dependent protease LA [Borreliella afzelii HLJ01]